MEESLPPGFRFHPTDEELIAYYLTRKVSDNGFTSKAIAVVDLNKSEPWDLPGKASMGEKEWYFFNMRDRKYPTGLRTNRATESGYWKTTGKDKEIFQAGILLGMKKTLVFYTGRAPRGEKSNWVMHEYRLENKHPFKPSKEEWVVCRVFKKSSASKKPQQASSSNQCLEESPCETNSLVNEFGDIELPNLNNNISKSSSTACLSNNNNISAQTQSYNSTNCDQNSNIINTSMNLNMNNYPIALSEVQMPNSLPISLPWPSGLLNPGLSVNSLLLKALQLRNLQQREATCSSSDHHFATNYNMRQGINMNPLGSDLSSCLNINANIASSSSSKVLECIPQTQEQQEQPFNLDSIW